MVVGSSGTVMMKVRRHVWEKLQSLRSDLQASVSATDPDYLQKDRVSLSDVVEMLLNFYEHPPTVLSKRRRKKK